MSDPNGSGAESRDQHRQRTLKKGRVLISETTTIDCVIRDISDKGARLQFAALTVLPKRFRLLNVTDNIIRPAKLVWQRSELVGVSFSD